VGPRTGLDGMEKILGSTGTRTPTPLSSSPLPVAVPTMLSRILLFNEQNKMLEFAFYSIFWPQEFTLLSDIGVCKCKGLVLI
jgi:hypothetical protein